MPGAAYFGSSHFIIQVLALDFEHELVEQAPIAVIMMEGVPRVEWASRDGEAELVRSRKVSARVGRHHSTHGALAFELFLAHGTTHSSDGDIATDSLKGYFVARAVGDISVACLVANRGGVGWQDTVAEVDATRPRARGLDGGAEELRYSLQKCH